MKFVSDKVYQFQIGVTLQDGVARVLVTNGAEDYDVEALKILKQHLEKTISESYFTVVGHRLFSDSAFTFDTGFFTLPI